MAPQSLALLVSAVLIAPVTVISVSTADVSAPAGDRVTVISHPESAYKALAPLQQKGRYKKQGDNCVWDANDGGPNQCTPQTKGRFKKGANDSCTWDANDAGPDQCRPPKGRWKKGGDNSCAWDRNDEGPDQCNPRQAK